MTSGSYSSMSAKAIRVWGSRGPIGRGLAGRALLLAALIAAIPLASTFAQTTAPEQQPAVAPLTNPESGRDAVRQQAADERMAALLLSEAREELELGDLRNARRRLEIIVTRFASTSVGTRARRLLEQLSLIDGAPMPAMPKAAPVEPRRAGEPTGVQLATRAPGASLLEADFSASGGDRCRRTGSPRPPRESELAAPSSPGLRQDRRLCRRHRRRRYEQRTRAASCRDRAGSSRRGRHFRDTHAHFGLWSGEQGRRLRRRGMHRAKPPRHPYSDGCPRCSPRFPAARSRSDYPRTPRQVVSCGVCWR